GMAAAENMSDMGLRRMDTYPSMAWVRASMPDPAVICGGQRRVRAGSTTAALAKRCLLYITFLAPPSARWVNTAMWVTSEPVPAVVGQRILGSPRPGTLFMPRKSAVGR